MTPERRFSADDGIPTDINAGEVYRLCRRIEDRMIALSDSIDKDVHSLRTKLDANSIELALASSKIGVLEKRCDASSTVATGASEKVAQHALDIAHLQQSLGAIESKGKDWRGWIASGALGGGLALLPRLIEWLHH